MSRPSYGIELRLVLERWKTVPTEETCAAEHSKLIEHVVVEHSKLIRWSTLPFVPTVGMELLLDSHGTCVVVERVRYQQDYFDGQFILLCRALQCFSKPAFRGRLADLTQEGWEVDGV